MYRVCFSRITTSDCPFQPLTAVHYHILLLPFYGKHIFDFTIIISGTTLSFILGVWLLFKRILEPYDLRLFSFFAKVYSAFLLLKSENTKWILLYIFIIVYIRLHDYLMR